MFTVMMRRILLVVSEIPYMMFTEMKVMIFAPSSGNLIYENYNVVEKVVVNDASMSVLFLNGENLCLPLVQRRRIG